jgi:hypothetical protein
LTLEKKDSDISFGEVLEYRGFTGILKLGLSTEVHGLALKEAANTRRGSGVAASVFPYSDGLCHRWRRYVSITNRRNSSRRIDLTSCCGAVSEFAVLCFHDAAPAAALAVRVVGVRVWAELFRPRHESLQVR